nr:ribonuclease H-like domain-containing protein [Tanacetum cinerariifolium]
MHWKDTFLDLKAVCSLLIAEEMRLKSKVLSSPMDSSTPMVFVAGSSNNLRPSSTAQGKPWKPCFNFAKRNCRYGDSCRYVHHANAHRTMNVVGARENAGSPVVQQSWIECFNCKEFGHFAKECRKPKRVKDFAYHKEKMLLCKQAEQAQDIEILIQTCLIPLVIKTQNDSFIFVHEIKQEMHADLKYIESFEKEIDELESDKAEFSNMYDMILQEFLGKPAPFSNSLERRYFSKTKSVPKTNVSEGLSKPVTAQTLPHTARQVIIQLILFIVDSGCTKHMTGNLKLLCNFVEKFLGAVRYGNDQFALILGYGYLVQGNITINRVYYVEVLNHNLFSVGQFFDADLEVAFRKSTFFVRDLQELSAVKQKLMLLDSVAEGRINAAEYTKHMTGNLNLLCNFVEKYMGTVRFGNDQFAPILEYGDLVQGNITINRVYYIKGLNHNLFSVGQFCDADLEFALILGYGYLVQGNITINRVYYVEVLNNNLFSVGQFFDADLEDAFRKSTFFVRDLQVLLKEGLMLLSQVKAVNNKVLLLEQSANERGVFVQLGKGKDTWGGRVEAFGTVPVCCRDGSKMAMLTMWARRFLQKTGRNLGANGPTSMGFDMSKVECYNFHMKGHFARECRSPKDSRSPGAAEPQRRTVPSYQAEEEPANYALMDFSSSTSSSDTEPEQDLSHTTRPSAPIIEDRVSDSEDESETKASQFVPSFVQSTEHVKSPRHIVQPIETSIPVATPTPANPKSTSSDKIRIRKTYFHALLTHMTPQKHMVPTVVLTQYKQVFNTTVRPVSTAVPRIMVTRPRLSHPTLTKSKSPIRRHITRSPSPKTSNSPPRLTAAQAPVVSAAQGVQGQWGNPQHALKDKGVIDSGCSRHMIGNMSYLSNFEELNGRYVSFGGNPKGGKIFGKGKIKTCKLDFEDVYFVKELKFNLFSVSKMCAKKNSVLFTEIECLVLSSDFKLPDESQVLLRVPRENNMYNVNLQNVVPSGDLTCLFAKATLDESNLWHRSFSPSGDFVKFALLVPGLCLLSFEGLGFDLLAR